MHRVSVVVAALNGARHIDAQLQSIADQTMPPCELIVGDDGSSDGTPEIVELFSRRAPFPVRLIQQPVRLGYSENFLRCARTAVGDLIAFSDQDDVWVTQKLERTSRPFDDSDVMLCVHDVHLVGPDLQPIRRRRPPLGILTRLSLSARLFVPHGSRSVIRADLLDLCPPEGRPVTMYTWDDDHPQEHDEWAYFAANAAGNVTHIRERLSYFRRHESALGFDHETAHPKGASAQLTSRDDRQLECLARGALARAAYLRALAECTESARVASRFLAEADAYSSLAAAMGDRRTRLGRPRIQRALRTSSATLRGQYRSQGRGGLGALALCQDVQSLMAGDR